MTCQPTFSQPSCSQARHSSFATYLGILTSTVVALFFLIQHSLVSFDTWWHLALGDQILADFKMPLEAYSFTARGAEIESCWWLSDIIFALCFKFMGLRGLEALGGILVMLTCLILYRNALQLGSSAVVAVLFVLLFALSSNTLLILRPQLFSFIFLGLCFQIYLRFIQGRVEGLKYLPVIFTLWANLHGAFLLGLALLASWTSLDFLMAYLDPANAKAKQQSKKLLVTFFASTFACLFNPEFFKIFSAVLSHDPLATGLNQHINEWLPAAADDVPGFHLSILLALPVIYRVKASVKPFEICMFLASALMGLMSWRHVAPFGILALPILAAWFSRALHAQRQISPPQLGHLKPLFSSIFLVFIAVLNPTAPIDSTQMQRNFPVTATNWIKNQKAAGNIFNLFEWGGYLLFEFRGTPAIYIDSRILPYKDIFPNEYFKIVNANSGWELALSRWQIEQLIIKPTTPLNEALKSSREWRLAYQDTTANVWIKNG